MLGAGLAIVPREHVGKRRGRTKTSCCSRSRIPILGYYLTCLSCRRGYGRVSVKSRGKQRWLMANAEWKEAIRGQ